MQPYDDLARRERFGLTVFGVVTWRVPGHPARKPAIAVPALRVAVRYDNDSHSQSEELSAGHRTMIAHADHVRAVALSRSASGQTLLAASWARSLKHYGLTPEARKDTARLDAAALRESRESFGRMLAVSTPVMDRLHAGLGLAGCGVLLCDARGVVLDQRTPAGEDRTFEAAGLCSGAVWSEAAEGTNGIGTCIAEERVVTVFRDQHFRDCNTVMTCMGAPIFDDCGQLAAVLDVSSCRSDLSRALAAIVAQTVAAAARQIESDHFQSVFAKQRIIRGVGDGQRSSVLLAVDADDLVVGATRGARKAYGLGEVGLTSPRPADEILGDASRRGVGLESAERRELKRAIARANGNMTAAARALGIGRATLYRRARRLGIDRAQ